MALKPGTQVGPYEITAPLGAGGMGEVFRATDSKLKREVAIKALPDALVGDADRLARFEREAVVLASLNHPHIASIYGLEDSGGVPCLVLELVEGQTLAERFASGSVSMERALEIAVQIALALEAAHEKGVVHRDLKPANVKVTPDGTVKVLDFGLAKALADEADEIAGQAADSPTLTMATQAGMILGTAAYMSPEQARGKPVDKRTDVWAFGCVLYELLTGRLAFAGETASDSLARILEREPDWEALPPTTPLKIRELLKRCLKKDRRNRLHDVADARIEIEELLADPDRTAIEAPIDVERWSSRRPAFLWRGIILLVAGVALGAAGIAIWRGGQGKPAEVARTSIVSKDRLEPTAPLVLSQDGQSIAYVTTTRDDQGKTTWRIVTRSLDRFDETEVKGAITVASSQGDTLLQNLTYSPDGQWLAFIGPLSPGSSERRLYKSAADGSGQPVPLADLPDSVRSILWVDEQTIVGASNPPAIYEFPAGGGKTPPPRTLESGEQVISYFRPTSGLPGARQLLVAVDSYSDKGWHVNVALLDRQEGSLRVLIQGDNPVWSPTGHILFTRVDQLMAVAFDRDAGQVVGGAVPIEAGLRPNQRWIDAWFALGANGTLAYLAGGRESLDSQAVLVDRDGRVAAWSEERRLFGLRTTQAISPDGQWIWFNGVNWERGLEEIWISDYETPRVRPIAARPGMDCSHAAWLPDSSGLAVNCFNLAENSILLEPIDRSSESRVLLSSSRSAERFLPTSFSPDGSVLLFDHGSPDGYRVDALRLEADAEPSILISGTAQARSASYAPDGQWIAYASDESGSTQVYVRSITPELTLGAPHLVSAEAGERPVWSPSREGDTFILYYHSGTDVMETRITTEPAFRVSRPVKLHDLTQLRALEVAPTPDGRLAITQASEEGGNPYQINLVFNLFEELKRLSKE